MAKVFYRGESRGKIPCQRPNPTAKTWHKIWMAGLSPNHDTIPIPSIQNSQKKCQKILVYIRSPTPFDSAVTVSARPPNFECTHLLLRSADWWRHNILFSIAWTIWIMINNENSTNLPADSLQAPQIQIVWGFLSGPRDRQWDHVLLLISKP